MTSFRIRGISARARAHKSVSVLAVAAVAAALTTVAAAGPAGAVAAHGGRHHHAAAAAPGSGPAADETTVSQNDLRDGWDPNEPTLTPAALEDGSFGQIFKTAVSGQVYGQPLIIGNTLIVATENDWVYGLDATTGAVLWKTSLGTPFNITSCTDLQPNIGVTSTGVYDPSTNTVYELGLVHETSWEWHLFGLNVSTGAITFKQRIAGHPTNDSALTFSPLVQGQRTGLLLMNGWVYGAFASHCDHDSYEGYVAGWNVGSPGTTTLWADDIGVANRKGGVWQSGGGIMSDGSGRIFIASGNGISPPTGSGSSPPAQLAESVIRLQPQPDGSLKPQDFFSPNNAPSLDQSDSDLGAGGPTGLPFGTTTFPDIMMQAGKGQEIYLLNRDNLGGRHSTNQDLAEVKPIAKQWNHPAIFADTTTLTSSNASSSNDYMIYVGKSDYMREFKAGVSSSDKPTLKDVNNSTFTLGYTSGAPAITSNGTDPSTGIIWEEHHSDATGTGGFLGAWQLLGVPRSGGGTKLSEIWAAPIGTGAKFSEVATGNGMVYVGTRDGNVYGFGITGGAALKSSGSAQFSDTAVGSSATRQVTLTATTTVTVTGAAVSAGGTSVPFALGKVTLTHPGGKPASATFPVTLHNGDVLRAAVKFAPGAIGGAEGAVTFTTSTGSAAPVSVPLIGNGTQNGLFSTTPAISFNIVEQDGMLITNVPVGTSDPQLTDIVNGGTKPVRVKSVIPPSGTYKAIGLPKAGTVIRPGEAIPVQVVYTPNQAVTSNDSFTIIPSSGASATVSLTGTGLPPVSRFTASPGVVNFGSVPVGRTVTKEIHVVNAGNQASLMGRTGVPGGPFGAPLRATPGLPVNQGYDLELPVTFHPTRAGAFHGTYKVTWTDEFGQHSLNVPITGTGVG
jgi:ASPM-SPD-2-Hydin domain-containing protein/putative pyrroloquinoline-quinone binding quinoprotein/putative pyrroloquinoline-quinone-binding quinoprotein